MAAGPLQASCSVLMLLVLAASAKKDTKPDDVLATEKERLEKSGFQCSQKQLKNLHSMLLKNPNDDATVHCLVKFLQDNAKDGFMWSLLGAAFDRRGKKFSSQANSCFKQAAKMSGKFPAFINDWHYIGPFVIGKTEFDGDPLEAFGGIVNISQYRLDDLITYPSELVPHGKVKWVKVKQGSEKKAVRVAPNVNWNELVSALGSLGITEWQGWVVGEMAINQDEITVLVQCLGVSTVFINGVPITGDFYHREQFQFSIRLVRGVHQVRVKLRAKVQAMFQCSFKAPPKDGFEILKPSFLPDIYDGHLFSQYLTVPIANHKSDKWLKVSRVSISDQSYGEPLEAEVFKNNYSVAPGQTRPVIIKLSSSDSRIMEQCRDIDFTLNCKTPEGQASIPLTLRCRKKRESFLFTFVDHDGSVQHAAAVEPIGMCQENTCPTLLTLHGTTVPPQNQADSYKRMVNKEFQFGVQGMWLLAPTRHGAHNWEGPGALTAITALDALVRLTQEHQWIEYAANSQHILFEGHSMGGHGAWHLATHFPDRAIGLAALAGWIKKEEYGDSNLFFVHDIATSHTDAAVKAVMEACISENDADRHISNLWKIPVLCRIGGSDRTVHPYFTRRMFRLLKEAGSQVTFTELEGREHWWWDTWETNDGGVVNDKQMRGFAADCLDAHNSKKPVDGNTGTCSAEGCEGDEGGEGNAWKIPVAETGLAELVIVNPAFGEGLRGVQILQQIVPFRTSTVKINITADTAFLATTNVKRFKVTEPPNRPVQWPHKTITIDGKYTISKTDAEIVLKSNTAHFCKIAGMWEVCTDDVHQEIQRGPLTLGPARRVAEKDFLITVGTQGKEDAVEWLQSYAVYIANLFFLTSDTLATVVKDVDVSSQQIENTNLIIIGGPESNKHTASFLSKLPVEVDETTIILGDCSFADSRMGLMTLAPNGARHLALILMGTSFEGLADIVSLATPTIPPMARSPFSNLLPDFVITGEEYRRRGPGGFACAGFWGNQWELRQDLISCACGTQ